MQLVSMKELMDHAFANNYAVPAFNVCNMEMMRGVLETAAELRSPVILGIHPHEVAYFGNAATAVAVATSLAAQFEGKFAIHLDHGGSLNEVMHCVRGGFSSVMFDGSPLPLEENISITKKIVELTRPIGVTVEAEIGTIGMTSEFGEKLENAHLSDPVSAQRLAETGIDCLAVAIGNAHGWYDGVPKLEFELLETIVQRVKIPLVLHGGSGIPVESIRRAIRMGIAKVNVGIALRQAFINEMKDFMEKNPEETGVMSILGSAKDKMKVPVKQYMEMCMSIGQLDK